MSTLSLKTIPFAFSGKQNKLRGGSQNDFLIEDLETSVGFSLL